MLVMIVLWLFLGAAIRSLPLSIQHHIPDIVLVAITEKVPDLGHLLQ